MRVLHVLEAVRGGTSRHVVDVVRHVGGAEHHVAVPPVERPVDASGALVDAPALEAMVAAGAVLHWVDMRRTPPQPANALAVRRLHHLLRYLSPTVVHGHSSVGGALGRMAAKLGGHPAVYTPNGLATSGLALLAERALGPLTDRLVAVSASEANVAVGELSLPPARVAIIANGIDLDPPAAATVDLRQRVGIAAGTPLVGTVARLVDQKAPVEFVRTCAAVARVRPEVHFLLIGMGPLQTAVDAAVAAHGLGSRFHQIDHLADAADALGQLDVFVLPSRFEGAPYTPLEAMRAGVPVVLSDVVGNHDAVEHGLSGYLRRFGDSDAMGGDVLSLLGDPARRARVTSAAKVRLEQRFDVRRMGERLGALYQEVAAARS